MPTTEAKNRETYWLIAVAVVTFTVIVGVSMWHQREPGPQNGPAPLKASPQRPFVMPNEPGAPIAREAAQSPPVSPQTPPRRRALWTPPPQSSSPDDPTAEETQKPPEPVPAEVPAILVVESGADPSERRVTLKNTSSQPLSVELHISNRNTGVASTTTVTVPPHRKRDVSELGVTLSPGDQVTMQSPGYLDHVLNVN
jgi:hypothetical protein